MQGHIELKFFTLIFLVAVLTMLFNCSKRKFKFILPFGIVLLLSSFNLGVLSDELFQIYNDKAHYSNNINGTELNAAFEGRFINQEQRSNSICYIIKVEKWYLTDSTFRTVVGKIQLITDQDDFQIGDIVRVKGRLTEFEEPINLHTFDYKQFQLRRKIVHQVYKPKISLVERNESLLNSLKKNSQKKIQNLFLSTESKAILSAMLLGNKSGLQGVEKDFRNTGTSHVLAISGLHVGIISGMLYFLLSFLPLRASRLKYILIILGTWSFCLLSGFAPSTIRASLMVSCYFIGKILGEKGNAINFCFVAGFFMLILNPSQIYDIGFQFSFLAILGILIFYKPIQRILILKGLKERLWQMTVLSLAAQVMLMPLSLYYFHEFPLLFLPASLIAIPATFLIIALAVICLSIDYLIPDITVISQILDSLIQFFLKFLNILANIDGTLILNLSPTITELVLYYLALTSISMYFLYAKKKGLYLFMLFFVFLLIVQFPINTDINQPQVVLYAHDKEIHLDFICGGTTLSIDEKSYKKGNSEWFRKPFLISRNVKSQEQLELQTKQNVSFEVLGKSLLIVNQDEDIIDNHDYILLNTTLNSHICMPDQAIIVDFGKNLELQKLHPNIYTKTQFIIQN